MILCQQVEEPHCHCNWLLTTCQVVPTYSHVKVKIKEVQDVRQFIVNSVNLNYSFCYLTTFLATPLASQVAPSGIPTPRMVKFLLYFF